jgi:hypothetical protein
MQVFWRCGYAFICQSNGWNWNGHVNRMYNERKLIRVFNTNPQGRRLGGRSKNVGGNVYKQMLI